MKRKLLLLIGITLFLGSRYACTMDADDLTPLLFVDSDSETDPPTTTAYELKQVTTEHTVGLIVAYEKGLKTREDNILVGRFLGITECEPTLAAQKIFNFAQLTSIKFSHNKITVIPDELFSLATNLIELNLAHNRITQIPLHLPQHTTLKTLCLHDNHLSTAHLEPLFLKLPNLKHLSLHNNQITDYGTMQQKHTSLEELWIDAPESNSIRQKLNAYYLKKMIAKHCTNLTAEFCEGDSSIQELYTTRKIRIGKCISTFAMTASWCISACAGLVSIIIVSDRTLSANFEKTIIDNTISQDPIVLIPKLTSASLGIGALTGLVLSPLVSTCRCLINRDDHTEKVFSKQIARYPAVKGKD